MARQLAWFQAIMCEDICANHTLGKQFCICSSNRKSRLEIITVRFLYVTFLGAEGDGENVLSSELRLAHGTNLSMPTMPCEFNWGQWPSTSPPFYWSPRYFLQFSQVAITSFRTAFGERCAYVFRSSELWLPSSIAVKFALFSTIFIYFFIFAVLMNI